VGSPRTILLADDEPQVREAMAVALRRKGYRVIETDDGADAVRLIADEPPDLVVVDMLLPGASGFRVAQAVRDATDGRTPVVMVSANSSDVHQDYAFASGVDRFLPKPFALGKLVDLVASLCPPPGGSKPIPVAAAFRT
jgi:DNA-binding response OmpR family regulator